LDSYGNEGNEGIEGSESNEGSERIDNGSFAPGPQSDAEIDEDSIYDLFPPGASDGNGPDQGFNTWVKLNDESLFTEDALANPVIQEFLKAPFALNYAQFKSSHREAEYWIHKPARAMTGDVEGIGGTFEGFPDQDPIITTTVVNHENTLAFWVNRTVAIADGKSVGQMVHKQLPPK
jgi:hypothetical protein